MYAHANKDEVSESDVVRVAALDKATVNRFRHKINERNVSTIPESPVSPSSGGSRGGWRDASPTRQGYH